MSITLFSCFLSRSHSLFHLLPSFHSGSHLSPFVFLSSSSSLHASFLPSLLAHRPPSPISLYPKLSGGCELTVVLQDFNAGHSSELTIQVGQTVELLERPSERPGWCLVRTTERSPPQEGLVPSSALCISHSRSSVEMDCFFPLVKGRGN